jgi:hypothetical protein
METSTTKQHAIGQPQAIGNPGRVPSWLPLLGAAPFLGLLVFSPATLMVAVFGLLPAIVAWTVDRSKEKAAAYSVGCLNLAGVFPYLLPVWFAGDGIGAAMDILTDVLALAVMYGAAACGWLLFLLLPPTVWAVQKVFAERRVTELKDDQERLIEQWGEKVAERSDTLRPNNP